MSAQSSTRALERRQFFPVGRLALVAAQPWAWVALLTVAAFLLRRYRLGAESFWFDEADIVSRAGRPLSTLLGGFTQAGENGPLYTLILHYWLAFIGAFPAPARGLHLLFGHEMEAPVRGLSALFGTAAIPLMYALGRKVGGAALGLVSALLLTFNPFHIWHSQDAKMYTLLVCTTLAGTLLYIEALDRNTAPLWAGYVIASWVMLTTHSMAGLVLLAQLAATPFLVKHRHEPHEPQGRPATRALWVRWGWAMLFIMAPLFPIAWLRLAALATNTVDVGGWYAATGLADILSTIFTSFAVNRAGQPWELVGGATMALLAGIGAWFLLKGHASQEAGALSATEPARRSVLRTDKSAIVFALWLVPIILFWLITLAIPLFQQRYLIMVLPPYLLMAAAGLLLLRRIHTLLMGVAAGLLAVASFAALAGVNYSPQPQKEDWRGAMVYVQDHLRLRDAIVVFPGYLLAAADTYYTPGGPGQVPKVPVLAPVPSLKTQGFGERELQTALREAVRCHERVWLVISPVRRQLEDPKNLVLNWFQQNWLTFDTKQFNGVTVYGISFNGQPECWFPPPDYPESHTFVNGLNFWGYTYEIRADATEQRDASYFPLTLYWRTDKEMDKDYIFRVRIMRGDRVVVDDAQGGLNGYWPTSQWYRDAAIIDYRDLRLPGGLTPGNYTVTLQVYPEGMPDQPLKLEDGSTEIRFETPLMIVPWETGSRN